MDNNYNYSYMDNDYNYSQGQQETQLEPYGTIVVDPLKILPTNIS
jgi:hypothetical protein